MDKKKIIGIVVFIVLGLFIFTFANPGPSTLDPVEVPGQEDQETDDDKQQEEEKEEQDEEKQDETVGNIGDEEQNETLVDYYQLALEAIEKAEESLLQNDVDSAKDLVENVNNNKQDLVDRVENVQNVIDYNKLLTELENKTNSSTNKDELNSARDYNTSTELANKLASLNDDANKEKLLNRYNALLPKLNDTTAPVVSGLDKEYTNQIVKLTITDDSSFSATLNGKNYVSGNEIKEDGVYNLVAVDASFNETKVIFTVDTTNPELVPSYWRKTVEANKDAIFTDFPTVSGKDNLSTDVKVELVNNTVDMSTPGEYKLQYVTTDEAGNKAYNDIFIKVVDTTKPEIKLDLLLDNGYTNNGNVTITDLSSFDVIVKINGEEKHKYSGESYKRADLSWLGDGAYEIIVTDASGNVSTKTFTLDKTAPKTSAANILINGDSNNQKIFYGTYGDKIYTYVRFNEELKNIPTFKLINNGKEYIIDEKDITVRKNDNGEYQYSAYVELTKELGMIDGEITMNVSNIEDKAGNKIDDIIKPTNGHIVYLDTTPAGRVYSTLDFDGTGIEPEIDGTRRTYYIKNGSSFVFRMQFTEQLLENPILNVDNKQVELKLVDKYVTEEGKYIYQGKVEINAEDNFKDGILVLILSNVKDLAGNETADIKILDQTVTSNDRTAIVDNTAPTISIVGTEGLNKNEYRIESGTAISLDDILATATDASFDEDMKIEPKRVDFLAPGSVLEDNIYNYDYKTNGFDTRKVGRYNIYYQVTDKAGNVSEEKLMMLVMTDTTAPVVTINGKTDTYVEFGSEYKELGATMTDNVDATITDLQPTKINLYDLNGKFLGNVTETGVDPTVEGRYLLYYDYVDGAGNSSKTDNGYTPYDAKRWVIVEDTTAPKITGVASNTTYFGSIDYNMSDVNGIKYIYYDFTHNYQSCEELIEAYNNGISGVGREDVKGKTDYAGNYPIPAGYAFKGVSYCAVDNGYNENKTFMNNISVYADTSADTILKAISENNGTIILPKNQNIILNQDLVINANTTIVGNGATVSGKVIIAGDNVVVKDIKLTDNLVVTGSNAVLDGVTMLNVNSAGTGKGNGYQVIKVNTNGNFTMKNSVIDNTYSKGSFYNAINISAKGKVEIENNKFINIENVYNIIEFSQSTPTATGTIIKGNEFTGMSKNNVISMFLFEDGNVITIEDNYFDFSGNALRISNYSNAKNVVINVNNNKYNDTLDGEYAGFMFFQEVKNESFAGITINVTNLIGPDDVKITSTTTGKHSFNYYYSDHNSLTKEDYATINFLD